VVGGGRAEWDGLSHRCIIHSSTSTPQPTKLQPTARHNKSPQTSAAAAVVNAMAAERDAYKIAAQEATQRAQSIAAENVELENSLLETKSARLKAEKAAGSASSRLSKLEGRLEGAEEDAACAQREVEALTKQRRLLLARTMQAEARARALAGSAGDDRQRIAEEAAAAAAELVDSVAGSLERAGGSQKGGKQQQQQRASVETADAVVQTSGAAGGSGGSGTALPSTKLAADALRMLLTTSAAAATAARTGGAGPEITAAADDGDGSSPTAAAQPPFDLSAALASLESWLPPASSAPATNDAAGAAAAVIASYGPGEDEQRLVDSISSLLEDLEGSWGALSSDLKHLQALNRELEDSNADLSQQVKRLVREAAAAGVKLTPLPALSEQRDGAANDQQHQQQHHATAAADADPRLHTPLHTPVQQQHQQRPHDQQEAVLRSRQTPGGESVADNGGLATPLGPLFHASPTCKAAAYMAVADAVAAGARASPERAPSAASRAAVGAPVSRSAQGPAQSGSAAEGAGAASFAGGEGAPRVGRGGGGGAREGEEEGVHVPARSQSSRNSAARQWGVFGMLAGGRRGAESSPVA